MKPWTQRDPAQKQRHAGGTDPGPHGTRARWPRPPAPATLPARRSGSSPEKATQCPLSRVNLVVRLTPRTIRSALHAPSEQDIYGQQ